VGRDEAAAKTGSGDDSESGKGTFNMDLKAGQKEHAPSKGHGDRVYYESLFRQVSYSVRTRARSK